MEYKRNGQKYPLKYTTREQILMTSKALELPIHSENWDYSRWADFGLICEAIAEKWYKEKERERLVNGWLAVKDVE
jgi:hypothetical protein